MPVKIRIPAALRKLTNNEACLEVSAGTVAEALGAVCLRFPAVKERLVDEQGALRRFVNLYVNDEDIRFLQGQETPLQPGDELSIIPAIAGG